MIAPKHCSHVCFEIPEVLTKGIIEEQAHSRKTHMALHAAVRWLSVTTALLVVLRRFCHMRESCSNEFKWPSSLPKQTFRPPWPISSNTFCGSTVTSASLSRYALK